MAADTVRLVALLMDETWPTTPPVKTMTAEVTRITADLTAANGKVTQLTTELAAAKSEAADLKSKFEALKASGAPAAVATGAPSAGAGGGEENVFLTTNLSAQCELMKRDPARAEALQAAAKTAKSVASKTAK